MAFGGFFGGGSGSSSSDDNSSSSTSSSSSDSNIPSNPFGSTPTSTFSSSSSSSSSNESSQIVQRLQTAVSMQANMINAKYLISRINENCFERCVPAPGTSLSSKEQTCLSSCMEKYIDAWNVTSRSYVARLQREGANISGITGAGTPGAGGKEMF